MKKKAKPIMIQGTASNVGKSILVAGLCRIFKQDGYNVAPFKAQNMALNSFVTRDGLEMGRAQATQALACKIEPDVRMNPVLLKPNSDTGSQIIVMGKASGNLEAKDYYSRKEILRPIVKTAYDNLAQDFDIVVMEGAGSCAEINLKENDIVNMNAARMANSPVIIAGDIDRGGVFAHFLGTYEMMDDSEKELIKGFLINKFRGDADLLNPAIDYLTDKTNVKTLGVVPWLHKLNIPEEDSVDFKDMVGKKEFDPSYNINIAVIDLPHISNFTDFDSLQVEDDVNIAVVNSAQNLEKYDWIILPGSKNTIGDMNYLIKEGFVEKLKSIQHRAYITGICGGYQILGKKILDESGVEAGTKTVDGLGFLNHTTNFQNEKHLSQTKCRTLDSKYEINGYEIHHGVTESQDDKYLINDAGETLATINKEKNIWGTYLHGIFDNDSFRNHLLNQIRVKKGLIISEVKTYSIDSEFDRLADILRESLNMNEIYNVMELK